MDGSSSLHVERRGGVFTCRSRSLAELWADCILQAPGSRSRKLVVGAPGRWDLQSASAGVCLQETEMSLPLPQTIRLTEDKLQSP